MAEKTHLARQEEAVSEQGIQVRSSDPGSPTSNQTWLNTTEEHFKYGSSSKVMDGLTSEYDAGNSGSALTIDFTDGYSQKVTLTGDVTFTFTNPQNGKNYLLKLVQDATGSRTVTWPANVKWSDGITPVISETASHCDIVSLYYDGTNYFASIVQNYDLS
jgi:hypothetical protein